MAINYYYLQECKHVGTTLIITCSVSTKFATFPFLSEPRVLYLVPEMVSTYSLLGIERTCSMSTAARNNNKRKRIAAY